MGVLYDASGKEKVKDCCKPPSKYSWKNASGYWWSAMELNSVWECDDCGKLYVTRGGNGIEEWKPLRWYHFTALNMTKAERKSIEQGI